MFLLSFLSLYCLVFWHERFEHEPAEQIGNCTVAEDDEIACGFALETEEVHLCLVGIVEEIAAYPVDED